MRPLRRAAATALLLPPVLLVTAVPAAAHDRDRDGGRDRDLPAVYTLRGDAGGSAFEGITVDHDDRDTFYVTEVTGGEIHRGDADDPDTEVWIDEEAALADGRRTAVGIATDHRGRVFVAGGDNRTLVGTAEAPDFWIYDDDRELITALRMPVAGEVFLNDVVVGPDGAAYVTDSVTPRVFRIARENGGWTATLWADAAATIPQTGDFGLNGIEVAPDHRSLVVAQSDVGALWRFDLRTAAATRIATGSVDLTSADGLVVKDRTLVAVRNFPHVLTYLRLDRRTTSAELRAEVPTDPERVFTTGDVVEGRLLLVDSQFDERAAGTLTPESEVVARPFRP
ncbi:SMP-30/gluconolactonase/LRE family protein [Geodermatophilus sp. SYSU D00815]